jgi:hypothetical protein
MKSEPIVISAHQPNFMPYLGFFDKMLKSDIFVIRDEVLYVKKEFHNRNRIRINSNNPSNLQSKWLNVPVENRRDYIKNILIKKDARKKRDILWNEKIVQDIKSNYQRTPYFDYYFPKIEEIFNDPDDNLVSLNMKIIEFLSESFNIKTKIVMASDLGLKQKNYIKLDASEDLANICKLLGGDIYLSGSGGRGYLNSKSFIKNNINVKFQEFNHPVYPQAFPGFLPHMSAIDALFCCGKGVLSKSIPVPKLKI